MGSIGGSIGRAVSGSIWTNTFLHKLQQTLPESALPDSATIYGPLTAQLSYPVGSPTRDAIVETY
ncbi:hypothetical protein N7451_007289 [Penicillium sp. IBT 35674x]|nr:hypothetical protein N7451_007289 [Penicillium sp. IBT 35674x]